jgi:hypothetical protein
VLSLIPPDEGATGLPVGEGNAIPGPLGFVVPVAAVAVFVEPIVGVVGAVKGDGSVLEPG